MLKVAGSHRATTLVLFALGLIAQVVIVGMAVHAAGPVSAQGSGCDLNDPNTPEAFCVNATYGRRQQQITITSSLTHVALGQPFTFFVSATGESETMDVTIRNLSNLGQYQSITPNEGCTSTPKEIVCQYDSDGTETTRSWRVGVLPSTTGSVFHRIEISADDAPALVGDVRINSGTSPPPSTPFAATASAPMAAIGPYTGNWSAMFPTTEIDLFASGAIATNPPANATYGPLVLMPSGDVFPFPPPPAAPVEFDALVSQPLSGTSSVVNMAFTVMPSTVPAASHYNSFSFQVDRGGGGPLQLHVPTAIVRNQVAVQATDATAAESGVNTGTFRVSRSGSTTLPLLVEYMLGGTATLGSDFNITPPAGSVTIPAGAPSAEITVTPIADGLGEATETAVLTLIPRTTYVVSPLNRATVNIFSSTGISLPVVTVVATDATATEAGRTTGAFALRRTGSPAAPLTVFFTVAGTATRGSDYTALPVSVTIPAGMLSVPVLVRPIDDLLMEGTETVVLTLAVRPTYTVGAPSSATMNIFSNEIVTVMATDPIATEAGLTTGTFRVSRTGLATAALTVFFTVTGTATRGSDYVPLPVSVVIPTGALSALVLVRPLDDPLMEGSETVVLTLAPRPNYTLGAPSSATVNIVSNEVVTVTAMDPIATEAGLTTGTFKVSRTGLATAPLTVFYALGGTATRTGTGVDYAPLPGSVVIPAGASSALVTVTPNDDPLMEGTETVVLTLAPRPNYTLGSPSSATVNIISNEVVTVTATDPTATEAGNTTGRFTVRRTGLATPLTVFYIVTGSAVRGADYVITPAPFGSVTIPAGALSAVITVTPINDTQAEGFETVVLAVVPRPTYNVGPPSVATVNITSNE